MNTTFRKLFLLIGLYIAAQSFRIDNSPLRSAQLSQNIPVERSQQSHQKLISNETCKVTGYQFLGSSFLNSPRQLNQVVSRFWYYAKVSTTWKVNKTLSFSITSQQLSYRYNPKGQNVKISPANKEIMVSNGSVEVSMLFSWQKNSQNQKTWGYTIAKTTSYELSCIYQLVDDLQKGPGYPTINLKEYYPFKLRPFIITDFKNMSEEEKPFIMSLLNNVEATDNAIEIIQNGIANYYPISLQSAIKQNIVGYKKIYSYSDDIRKDDYGVPFVMKFNTVSCGYNLTKEGISYAYSLPLQESPYPCDSEQLYLNSSDTIKLFNAKIPLLHQRAFDVFSSLQQKFDPEWRVKAYCNGTDQFSQIKIYQASNSSFFVNMAWNCRLDVQNLHRDTFASLNLTGRLQVNGFPTTYYNDFWLKKFTLTSVQIDDSFGFKLKDKEKAETMVKSVAVKVLSSSTLTGSGWDHTLLFEKPNFLVTETGTFATDASFKSNLTAQ